MMAELQPFSRAEVGDDARDKHLAGLGAVADARGKLDGGAEEVVVLGDGFSGIQADADPHFAPGKLLLNLECSLDGADG